MPDELSTLSFRNDEAFQYFGAGRLSNKFDFLVFASPNARRIFGTSVLEIPSTSMKETDNMKNTAALADALAKPARVPPKHANQKHSARIHRGKPDATSQSVTSEASLNILTVEFQDALKKSVEGIIEAGNVLIRAKSQLKHGQWEEWIIRTLRFGQRARNGKANVREAQELMLLARHPVISNPNYFNALPARIRTLTELSQIPEDQLEEHIDTGVVHPGLTRSEVKKLKPPGPKPNRKNPVLAPTLPDAIKVFLQFCLDVGRPDVVLGYIRSLRETRLPPKEDFDLATEFARRIYESRGER
jgi:hypothetical protein